MLFPSVRNGTFIGTVRPRPGSDEEERCVRARVEANQLLKGTEMEMAEATSGEELKKIFETNTYQSQLAKLRKHVGGSSRNEIEKKCTLLGRRLRHSQLGQTSFDINLTKKYCKKLVERLGDLFWPKKTRNDASTQRRDMVEAFGIQNLRTILELVVPHDRAVCMQRFLSKDKTSYGRDWAAEQHIQKMDDWDANTIAMMNKRFVWFYEAFFGPESDQHSTDLEYWLTPMRACPESVNEQVMKQDKEDPVSDKELNIIRSIAWESVSKHCECPRRARIYYDTPECQASLQSLIRAQQGLTTPQGVVDYLHRLDNEKRRQLFFDFAVTFQMLYLIIDENTPASVAQEFRASLQNLVDFTIPIWYAICDGVVLASTQDKAIGIDADQGVNKDDYQNMMQWLKERSSVLQLNIEEKWCVKED